MSTPSIYVGTYHKYNSGSLAGKWLDLDDYADCADFYKAALELHKDEHDPELMFQDWENIPEEYISESSITQAFWDFLDTVENSHLDAEVFEAASYLDIPANEVEEAYRGSWESKSDFAAEYYEEIGTDLGHLESYIDWDRVAYDMLVNDFVEHDKHYFWRR